MSYARAIEQYTVCSAVGIDEGACVTAPPPDGCVCPLSHPLQALDSFVDCVDSLEPDASRVARISSLAQPPSYAMDGDATTYWRSPAGVHQVNLTVDLQGQYQLFSLHADFVSELPHSFSIERSTDGGASFSPWRYYSEDCMATYGMESSSERDVSDNNLVICMALPLNGSSNAVTLTLITEDSLPEELIGAQQDTYTQFSRFTHVRLRFEQLQGKGGMN